MHLKDSVPFLTIIYTYITTIKIRYRTSPSSPKVFECTFVGNLPPPPISNQCLTLITMD